MAIVLEEEKKPINWTTIIAIGFIILVIFIGGYYVFFQRPELIEVVAPVELQRISSLSSLQFKPEEVIEAPEFKMLRRYGGSFSVTSKVGRDNPFEPINF